MIRIYQAMLHRTALGKQVALDWWPLVLAIAGEDEKVTARVRTLPPTPESLARAPLAAPLDPLYSR